MWDEPWDFEGCHWHDMVMQRRKPNFHRVFNNRASFAPRPTYRQVKFHDLKFGERQCPRHRPLEDIGFDDNFRKVRTQWFEVFSVQSSPSSISLRSEEHTSE